MWSKLANIILKNRWFILAIVIILTVFFGYFAFTSLKIDNKYGNMLPKSSKAQSQYLDFKTKFGEDGSVLVIAIQDDSLYTNDHFRKWKLLGDSILQFDGVESVISEATLYSIKNIKTEKRFEPHRIFSDVKFREKSIKQIEREIKNNPVYSKLLYNDSSNVSLMLVSIDERFLSDQKKSSIVLKIESLADSFKEDFGQIHFAGLPHIRIIIGKRVINEMYIFIGLAIFVTSLLLYLFFRSFRLVMVCITVVFISVIWSMGSIGLFGFNISILMALIPPLMIVIGIPNGIFLLTKYHQELRKNSNKIRAIFLVIQKIGVATFLTNLTTALGFATFIFTNSEKLIEFGIVASLNIIVVFLLSITIIPIFVSFLKTPKEKHLKHLDRKFAIGMLDKLVVLTTYHRKKVYLITVVLLVISFLGMTKIITTGNLTGDLPKGDIILKDVQFLQRNFGGAIPFEITVDYREKSRLFQTNNLKKIEAIQKVLLKDTLFSKSVSVVDFAKVINMAFYNNDSTHYRITSNRDKLKLKRYLDNFDLANSNPGSLSVKELVDTNSTTLRIRSQVKDLGSYEIAKEVDKMEKIIDSILNPEKTQIESFYKRFKKGNKNYIDSISQISPAVFNNLTRIVTKGNPDKIFELDLDPSTIHTYTSNNGFSQDLRSAIDNEYYKFTITGTSVVASEGTQYLVKNLISSILFAILLISILMALLFRSWRMVIISLIPNLIPLVITSGLMGYFGIPLKPSTLLVFSIAFGISVDDTIHYLAKYRQELKLYPWDIKRCVNSAIKESGLGMFYTSIVLFCGFSMFSFSQFGGTQALGLLISLTLIVAMITNLLVLPSLLMSLDKIVTTKSFKEPYFIIYDEESDFNFDDLQIKEPFELDSKK